MEVLQCDHFMQLKQQHPHTYAYGNANSLRAWHRWLYM